MECVLIVEDDVELNVITKTYLEHEGFQTASAYSCAEAEEELKKQHIDIILLDVMLPDENGNCLCERLRRQSVCPIIFVSCIDDKTTMLDALRVGGDDYMVKPVDYDQLVGKIHALLRRVGEYQNRAQVKKETRAFKQFYLDTSRRRAVRTVYGEEEEVDLSPIEFSLLRYMSEHPDTLLLYTDLYSSIWDSDSLGDVRTVMVHISKLRKKIDPGQSGIITTVRGAGYIFSDVDAAEVPVCR